MVEITIRTAREIEQERLAAKSEREKEIERLVCAIIFEARVFKNENNGVAWSRSVDDLVRRYVPELRQL